MSDSRRRAGLSRRMSTLELPMTTLRSGAVSALALSTIALTSARGRDAEVLGRARRGAGPGDVVAADHQLRHRVADAGVEALDDRDPADDRVRRPVGVAGDHEVDRRVLELAPRCPMIGPVPRRGGVAVDAVGAGDCPLVDDHDLDLHAPATEPARLALDPLGLVEERQARRVAGLDQLRRVANDRADDADPHAVDAEDLRGPHPVGRRARWPSRRRWWPGTGSSPGPGAAGSARSRSRTRGCRSSWRRAPTRSPRRSPGCPAAAPSSAARRRRCRPRPAAASCRAGRRPPRRTSSRAAPAPPTPSAMPLSIGLRRRVELTVEVVQPDDRDRRVPVAVVEQVAPHDALAAAPAPGRRAGTPRSAPGRCCGRRGRRRGRSPCRRPGTWPACWCCCRGPARPARSRAGRRTPSARTACRASPRRTGTAGWRTRPGRPCASGATCRRCCRRRSGCSAPRPS